MLGVAVDQRVGAGDAGLIVGGHDILREEAGQGRGSRGTSGQAGGGSESHDELRPMSMNVCMCVCVYSEPMMELGSVSEEQL